MPVKRDKKRLPFDRRHNGQKNAPNTGDMKGGRVFVKGTVGEVKRILNAAGIAYRRVRVSGYGGVVEVIFTQWKRLNPYSFFVGLKPYRIVHTPKFPSRLRQHRNF